MRDILLGITLQKGTRRAAGPNSERAEKIAELMQLMREDGIQSGESEVAYKKRVSRRFKYWLGRTNHLTPQRIYMLMRSAREGKNPPALLNWLLKNKYGKTKKEA